MLSTRLSNPAAIVSKESNHYNFFGSHIRRPNASPKQLASTSESRDNRMLDLVFILRLVVVIGPFLNYEEGCFKMNFERTDVIVKGIY